MFFVLNQELYIFRIANVHNSSAFGRNYKMGLQAILSRDKMDQAFPSIFAYCKWSNTGQWEGLEMRLMTTCIIYAWPCVVCFQQQYFLLGLK